MSTTQYNVRLPEETTTQIQELIEATGMTQTQLMIVAIDRMFQKEREFSMKRTTNPQEAAQAVQYVDSKKRAKKKKAKE
jgi:predicted DNA-binding protein